MTETPPSDDKGPLSPDGQWRWDGNTWVPSGAGEPLPTQKPPTAGKHMWIHWVVVLVIGAILCGVAIVLSPLVLIAGVILAALVAFKTGGVGSMIQRWSIWQRVPGLRGDRTAKSFAAVLLLYTIPIPGLVTAAAIVGAAGTPTNTTNPATHTTTALNPSPTPSPQSSPSPEPTPSPSPQPSPTPKAAPSPSPAASTPPVTGFGATNADWESHHTAYSGCSPGSCYNPDPNLPQTNGHVGIRYYAVDHSNGHVTNYQMNLPQQTPISAAKAEALQEFPSDATALWYQVKDSCSQMEVKSAALGAALGNSAIGDAAGYAFVEFSTLAADGSSGYTEGNINNLILTLGSYPTPSDASGC